MAADSVASKINTDARRRVRSRSKSDFMVSLTSSGNQPLGWLVLFVQYVQFVLFVLIVQPVQLFPAPIFSIASGGQTRLAGGSCVSGKSHSGNRSILIDVPWPKESRRRRPNA
jgi:hypothetical protein